METLGIVPADVPASRIEWAKKSIVADFVDEIVRDTVGRRRYRCVLEAIVRNLKVREGGFLTTTGITIPYYLSLPTNFLDSAIAPLLVSLFIDALFKILARMNLAKDEKVLLIGMEVAGGILVSQLAAVEDPRLSERCEFIYMRKELKRTGTQQQLEAKQILTDRTSESPRMKAIWVDDVMSTGSSLCKGIKTLYEDYNLEVVACLYVVDRARDRQNLDIEKQVLSDPRFVDGHTKLYAIIDIESIDERYKARLEGASPSSPAVSDMDTLGVVPADVPASRIEWAKKSIVADFVDEIVSSGVGKGNYEKVLNSIVGNVKTRDGGDFYTTTGVSIPYYLSMPTNFLDFSVAPALVQLFTDALIKIISRIELAKDEKVLLIGMEVAGGILVSQLAAIANPAIASRCDCIYLRKEFKGSGTRQELEAKPIFTDRNAESPRMKAIWVDDVMSTGSSLCKGIKTLYEDYNLEVVACLYVVDRARDRQNLENEKQVLSDPRFVDGHTKLYAIIDIESIDERYKSRNQH